MSDWPSFCSYEFFKSVAVPIVGGLIGFGGVGATLYYSGYLQRKQMSDQLAHQKETLRKALAAELSANALHLKILESSADALGPGELLMIPLTSTSVIFDNNVAALGLLPANTVGLLLSAYQTAKWLPHLIDEYGAKDGRDRKVGPLYYLSVNPEKIENLKLATFAAAFVTQRALDHIVGMARPASSERLTPAQKRYVDALDRLYGR